jgi:hypothetical protein
MQYSVYRKELGLYDYYETQPSLGDIETPRNHHLRNTTELGADPDACAWSLPAGARMVGQGPFPKGMIASLPKGGFGLGGLSFDAPWVLPAMAGVALWWLTRKGRR